MSNLKTQIQQELDSHKQQVAEIKAGYQRAALEYCRKKCKKLDKKAIAAAKLGKTKFNAMYAPDEQSSWFKTVWKDVNWYAIIRQLNSEYPAYEFGLEKQKIGEYIDGLFYARRIPIHKQYIVARVKNL